MEPICSFPDCGAGTRARGLCGGHYYQWYVGLPLAPIARGVLARFWTKVDRSGACWLWTKAKNRNGYGVFRHEGRSTLAHRFAYRTLVGPIPLGMDLDHRCHKHACVNPDHLRPATVRQNAQNRAGAQMNSASGVRGVYWNRAERKWIVRAQHCGKAVYGGRFTDLDEATRAAIALRNRLFTHNDLDRGSGEDISVVGAGH